MVISTYLGLALISAYTISLLFKDGDFSYEELALEVD